VGEEGGVIPEWIHLLQVEARGIRRDAMAATKLLLALIADEFPATVTRIYGAVVAGDLPEQRFYEIAYESKVSEIGSRIDRMRSIFGR
jgi:hypothetical protein